MNNTGKTMGKLFTVLPLLIMAMVLVETAGCKTTRVNRPEPTPFSLVNKMDSLKPGTILVLSGNYDKYDYDLSLLCIQQFMHKTRFKPVQIERIKKVLKDYPLDIIDFRVPEELQGTPCMSETSKAMVDSLQKKFQTRYVFIVWHEGHASMTGGYIPASKHSIDIKSRLIRYPEGEIVGFSDFVYTQMVHDFQNYENGFSVYLGAAVDGIMKEFENATKPR